MRILLLRTLAALALAMVFSACTQKNTADQQAHQADPAASVALGVDRLLLFPNPIGMDPFAQDGGSFETDTKDYAIAYYAAIDPNNDKNTLDKWRKENAFIGYADPARQSQGTEHLAVFRDVKDLGYGRRMTGRRNSDDGSVAFYVENYNVAPGGVAGYSSDLNVDAAIRRDTQWHVGTNAIEWTTAKCLNKLNGYAYDFDPPDCDGTVKFAKYYNFSSVDGTRQLAVDLDGRGKKAMPGPCITCHGGRGDPLTPQDASGNKRFPLVENSLSRKRGDVQARLHGMNVDSFGFSVSQPGFAKSDMQPILRDFNQWIVCTYPSPTPGAQVPGNWAGNPCTRPTAGVNEWQGTAAEMIESWYGGAGWSQPFSDTYIPAADSTGNGWTSNTAIPGTTFTDTALYQSVVAPYCRTCHILRGTKNQSDIDFRNLGVPAAGTTPATGFLSYADRIKVHVFDRGNMPLAQIPHSDFWNSSAPQMLASFIDAQPNVDKATSGGAVLMPGRPIADPGPDRMVRTGANAVLTGENSLFASNFSWTNVSGPSTPQITNSNAMIAIFNASVAGKYVVRLTVNGGPFKDVNIWVDDNFPDPLNIRFAQVKNVLQNLTHATSQVPGGKKCVTCHVTGVASPTPPVFYNAFDRDGSGGSADTTDDDWFLKAVGGRVNLTEIAASPLLRKPSGNHHNGLTLLNTADTTSGGGLSNYSILYNWILAGMQPGGVAANAGASSSAQVTFSGAPLYASVALDGSLSIAATGYLWTVVSGPNGPTGAVPVITNPTSVSATLNVPNVGTYVVRLAVSDGVFSDSALRTITVTETPITASFTPLTGSTPVTFSGNPLRGDITLASTSMGSAAFCQWQANGPPGATLEGVAVPATVTTPCTSDATLRVPSTAVNTTNDVTLTAFGITPSSVTNSILIADGTASVVASLANTTTPQAVIFSGTASTITVPTYNDVTTDGFAGNISVAVVAANVSLNGNASTTPSGTTLSYSWCLSSQPDQARFPASIAVCPLTTSSGASATTTMSARATGPYAVQLTVTNGLSSHSISKVVQVNPFRGVKFSDFTGTNNDGYFNTTGCSGCHFYGGVAKYNPFSNNPNGSGFEQPQWENMTGIDATTLYERVRQRVNLGTPARSLLLLNPSNGNNGFNDNPPVGLNTTPHGGGCLPGFNIWGEPAFTGAHACADTSRANYDNFTNWILDGAPPGN